MKTMNQGMALNCLKRWATLSVPVITCMIFLFSFCACAPQQEIRPDVGSYVWPLPPEQPRLRYLKSLFGEADYWQRTSVDILAGERPSEDLAKPYGVTTDRAGRIYVTDTMKRAVFIFDEALKQVTLIGKNNLELLVPSGVAVDAMQNIYVIDTGHDAVLVFDRSDKLITTFGKEFLNNPSGIVIDDAKGRVYVVSSRTHRVEVFSLNGKHQFGFGGRGNAPGMFNYPMGIAMDTFGSLYVVDSGNFRIQVFNSEGVFVREFGRIGTEPGTFSRPKDAAIDFMGNVYVTDAAFNNFQIFDSVGRLLLFVGVSGMTGPGEFSLPAGIAIDTRMGRIYIADQLNRRVQAFEILK